MYKLKKNGVQVLSKIYYESMEKVFENVVQLDLQPPFKVIEVESNKDMTKDFLKYSEKLDFVFVKKEDVLEKLPQEFKELLSKDGSTLFFTYKDKNVKISNYFYLKSIPGFFFLYKKNCIAFGYEGMNILFVKVDGGEFPVYKVDVKKIQSNENYIIVSKNYKDFLSKLVEEKK